MVRIQKHGLAQPHVEKMGHARHMIKKLITVSSVAYITMRTSIWTKEETDTLLKYITEKRSLTAFSEKYKRSDTSIRARLKYVAAEMYLKDKKSFEEIYKLTGIDKSEVIISKIMPKLVVPPVIAIASPKPEPKPEPTFIAPLVPKLVIPNPSYTIRNESPFETVFSELVAPIIKSLSTIV
jgi:hypothetical protein